MLLSPQKRCWNNWMMMDGHNHLSWSVIWQSWNDDRYSQWCQAQVKEITPNPDIRPVKSTLWTFPEFTSFWECCFTHGSLGTLGKIYSFIEFSLHWWKALQNVCITVKRPPKIGGVLIMELYGQNKFNFNLNFNLQSAMQSKRKCGPQSISLKFLPVACSFSFLSCVFFWCEVLGEVNQTPK